MKSSWKRNPSGTPLPFDEIDGKVLGGGLHESLRPAHRRMPTIPIPWTPNPGGGTPTGRTEALATDLLSEGGERSRRSTIVNQGVPTGPPWLISW